MDKTRLKIELKDLDTFRLEIIDVNNNVVSGYCEQSVAEMSKFVDYLQNKIEKTNFWKDEIMLWENEYLNKDSSYYEFYEDINFYSISISLYGYFDEIKVDKHYDGYIDYIGHNEAKKYFNKVDGIKIKSDDYTITFLSNDKITLFNYLKNNVYHTYIEPIHKQIIK